MLMTNDDLETLAESFLGFKELALDSCEGFGLSGLAIFVGKCRQLRVLDLMDSWVERDETDWISCFPEGESHLESLIFECVDCPINFEALERLVSRSPSLKKLRLNGYLSIEQLYHLMIRAPQLTHLGTGSFSPSGMARQGEEEPDYVTAFAACRSLVCLSGFKTIIPDYLPAIYPVCANLTSLDFFHASLNAEQLKPIISNCHKLQFLCVCNSIRDEGLKAVATTCKELHKLQVFQQSIMIDSDILVSEVGLQAISEGCQKLQSITYYCKRMTNAALIAMSKICPDLEAQAISEGCQKLQSITYYCKRMTNAALIAMSKNCPDLEAFQLRIMGWHKPDLMTGEPMDEGFGAIVRNCKKLTSFTLSGLLTDKAYDYIGKYGKSVGTLKVTYAGDSDMGLKYVLEGCPQLQKLVIRRSQFVDAALLSGLHHFYNMRYLRVSSCRLTRQVCQEIANAMPRLVVQVNRSAYGEEMGDFDETLYMYRSLDGPRCPPNLLTSYI